MLQAVLDSVGYGLCHQLPERSFFGGGLQAPVCARDAGIYIGFAIALAILSLMRRDRPSQPPTTAVNVVLALGVIAMGIDGVTSYAGLRVTTNELRLLTGLMTGFALAAWIAPVLSSELWRRPGPGRVLEGARDVGAYLAALVLSYLVVWYGAPYLGVIYPVLTAATIIVTFATVNLVIVCLLPSFERRATRLRDAWVPILIAVGLSALQIAGSAWLKAWALGSLT
ncbi:MAG: DUF2085 domain-containing protein [Anaerosomatales bacterium]|nr:DUF2085 domain-containing protein [Anaerosomatales bacterium]MDT8434073.1 DUF2085 domain-containing protein [Anaerosomatales bacterium]